MSESEKKYDAYVINLDIAPERWEHMKSEFSDTILNLIQFTCKKSTNGRGWAEVGKTYADIMRKHKETDPDFNTKLCIVFEDDAFRIEDKKTFNERLKKIFKYLETHIGSYSHFQGGGVYPQPKEIECIDPLIIRCNYITCTTFTVFGKEAADSVFEYEKNIESVSDPIDNYIGQKNSGKILAPFPHLVWQIIGLPSNISSSDQKTTLNEAFRNSHKELLDFVKSKNIAIGGAKRKHTKAKTMSFLNKALKKYKRKVKSYFNRSLNVSQKGRVASETRRIYRTSKGASK